MTTISVPSSPPLASAPPRRATRKHGATEGLGRLRTYLQRELYAQFTPQGLANVGFGQARRLDDARKSAAKRSRNYWPCSRTMAAGACRPWVIGRGTIRSTPLIRRRPATATVPGLVVYVLRQAGLPADQPAVQRGVKWLRATNASPAAGSCAR